MSKPDPEKELPPDPDFDALGGIVPLRVNGLRFEESKNGIDVLAERSDAIRLRLNMTAATILAMCDGTRTCREIRNEFVSAYKSEAVEIAQDLKQVFIVLRRSELIALCGAPIQNEPTRSEYLPRTFHCNRGWAVRGILEQWGWREAEPLEIAELAIWHPYDEFRIAKYQSYELFQTTHLRNKKAIAENLTHAGVAEVMPETYSSFKDFEAKWDESGEDLWFVKMSSSTHSRDVDCFRDLPGIRKQARKYEKASSVYVIQKGVKNLVLSDDRKFTLRVFVLVSGGQVFVHRIVLKFIHPGVYDPDSVDPSVQVPEHDETIDKEADLEADFPAHFRSILGICRKTFNAVKFAFDYVDDPHRFQLFGLDFLLSVNNTATLIEVNDWPTTTPSAPAPGDDDLRVSSSRVMQDMLMLVLGGEQGRFIQLEAEHP